MVETIQKENGGVRHSLKGVELAEKIVKYLEDNEEMAESFPYEQVEELRKTFC